MYGFDVLHPALRGQTSGPATICERLVLVADEPLSACSVLAVWRIVPILKSSIGSSNDEVGRFAGIGFVEHHLFKERPAAKN